MTENYIDKIAKLFKQHPCELVTQAQLYEAVWEVDWYNGARQVVAQQISFTRKQLDGYIVNIQNEGYIYLPPDIVKVCDSL